MRMMSGSLVRAAFGLLVGLTFSIGCSGGDEPSVSSAGEVDVAAPGEAGLKREIDTVASILAGIEAARDAIARGDALDAASALGAPIDLLRTLLAEADSTAERLAGAAGGIDAESMREAGSPVARTYSKLVDAKGRIEDGDLAGADARLAEAQDLAEALPGS